MTGEAPGTGNDMPGDKMPDDGTPGDRMPGDRTPGQRMPDDGMPGSSGSGEDASKPGAGAADAPDIEEAIRQLTATGRATLGAGSKAAKAFRILLAADLSLARSAFGRTLALTAVAIVFGVSGWLLAMTTLIVWLSRGLGWSWSASLLLCATLSAVIAALATWFATRYFEHTRMQATRRQLARLGIGELADFMPDAGSQSSSEDATDDITKATEGKPPVKKGMGVDITPP